MSTPAGRVSEKATPVRASDRFGLVMVKFKVVVPPVNMVEAPNCLAMLGGAITFNGAVA